MTYLKTYLLVGEVDVRGCCSGVVERRRAFVVEPCGACGVLGAGGGAWRTAMDRVDTVDRRVNRRVEGYHLDCPVTHTYTLLINNKAMHPRVHRS